MPTPGVTGPDHDSVWALRHRDPAAFEAGVAALPPGPVTTYLAARVAMSQGRFDDCLDLCDQAEPALGEHDLWRARLLETRGNLLDVLGLATEAQQTLAVAAQLCATDGGLADRASVRQNLGALSFQPPSTALQLYQEALALAEEAGQEDLQGVILLNIQRVLAGQEGTLEERARLVERAEEVLDRAWPDLALDARCWAVHIALERGEPERAREIAATLPDPMSVTHLGVRADLAELVLDLAGQIGGVDDAIAVVRRVLAGPVYPMDLPPLHRKLSEALRDAGRREEALAAALSAYDLTESRDHGATVTAARALDTWFRTKTLREETHRESERADALAVALDQLHAAHARIQELSVRDPLTGLHNRQCLIDTGTAALASASPTRPAQVALIDLDKFKSVNDTYGHYAGDAVLREFASLLRGHLPGTDLVARYGGEEFVVVRPPGGHEEPDDEVSSLAVDLDRLRATARRAQVPRAGDGPSVLVTMSVGVVAAVDGDLPGALYRADQLMYVAKRDGGDRVYGPAHAARAHDRAVLGPTHQVRP